MDQNTISLEGHLNLSEKLRTLVTYTKEGSSRLQFPEHFDLSFPEGHAENELRGLLSSARAFYTMLGFEMAPDEINGVMGGMSGMTRKLAIYVAMSYINDRTIRVSAGVC